MERLTFNELRDCLAMSNEGQILDSFFAVEIGLDDYNAMWDAHVDILEDAQAFVEPETIISTFLTELYELLDVNTEDLEKVLGAAL